MTSMMMMMMMTSLTLFLTTSSQMMIQTTIVIQRMISIDSYLINGMVIHIDNISNNPTLLYRVVVSHVHVGVNIYLRYC